MFQCQIKKNPEHTMEVRKPAYLQKYVDFEFPPSNFIKQKFKNLKTLNEELVRLGLKIGFYRGRLFDRKNRQLARGYRSTFKCKQTACPAKLVYVEMEGNPYVEMEVFSNSHIHHKPSDIEHLKRQRIQLFIMDLPLSQNWENYQKWMYRFDIGSHDSRYLVEQLFWYNNTEEEIFTRLAYEKRIVRRVKDEEGNTVVVFITHEQMKRNYEMFGDTVNFDANYKMIKKLTVFGTKYGVGHFFGHDHNARLITFANCIFARRYQPYFKHIFEFFFDVVAGSHLPITFITDMFDPIVSALEEIQKERKYSILHLFNWFYVTNHIRQALQKDPRGEEIFYIFCQALASDKQSTYRAILQEITDMVEDTQVVSDFIQREEQYVLCMLPSKFVGFTILNCFGRRVYERVNTCTRFDSYAGTFFFTLLHTERILRRNIQKVTVINDNIIKHIAEKDIHDLQDKLEVRVMERLLQLFSSALNLDVEEIVPGVMLVKTGVDFVESQNSDQVYRVEYLHYREYWECECRLQYLFGLPCSHLIRVLREKKVGGSIKYYINQRWIHDKQDRIPQFSRPFITRRKRRP